ncbi:SRPBCC family protein [Prauserella oleivorans]|uniref:SRPBCC family protein n=1 Tax=Prauserella oleivorans TaxID=1478153 RepID=A0ABW5WEE8_9PSEU
MTSQATGAARKAGKAAKDTTKGTADTATGAAGSAKDAVGDLGASALLKKAVQQLASTVASRAASSVSDKVSSTAQNLTQYAESGGKGGLATALTGAQKLAEGKSPLGAIASTGMSKVTDKVKQAFGGGGGGGAKDQLKVTNIVESIEVGVPIDIAYDLWTQFTDFPSFMKKVENVDQEEDEKLKWKAQVLWSHRTWEATIEEQVPYERIVWRSEGEKGHVDGAVTFHELAPNLTKIVVVLEYYPQGFVERTGNIWRAPGRRARLELKHFQRHAMVHAILKPDEIEGWHGEIREGEVVSEDAVADREGGEDEGQEDEESAEEPSDETDEDTDEEADEEAEEEEPEEPEEPGEDTEDEEEPAPRPRRRRAVAASAPGSSRGTRTRRTRGGRS